MSLPFEYPFTISKGTKTHQPSLVVALGLRNIYGFGEAPAITYYDVTVEHMLEVLRGKAGMIERYALTDPKRFWHFLHHLIPGEHFLTCALDIAGWDLFARLRRQPLFALLGLKMDRLPRTDYTLGIDTAEKMIEKMEAHPWPLYKIKMNGAADIDLLRALRAHSGAEFRIDANESFDADDLIRLLPELESLGVQLIEQPLPKTRNEAMAGLRAHTRIPFFADESCVTEEDVKGCAQHFDGINIKLTKCGGITPALRMIEEARALGLKIMLGSMNESTIGTAAVAHLQPLVDEIDADGPLLLSQDAGTGLRYEDARVHVNGQPGTGVRFIGVSSASEQ